MVLIEAHGEFAVSWAVFTIFAWLVPHVMTEVARFRLALMGSTHWKEERSETLLQQGLRTISIHAGIAAGIGFVAIVVGACIVGPLTQNLDDRMSSVLSGFSRLVAAVVIFLLSYKIPKWLGVYYREKSLSGWDDPAVDGISVVRLAFHVRWAIMAQFAKIFFLLLPFFCKPHPGSVPVSILLGVVSGFAVLGVVFLGRTRFRDRKRAVAYGLVAFLALCSAAAFSSGCYYVQVVWGDVRDKGLDLALASFFVWIVVVGLLHWLFYWLDKRRMRDIETRLFFGEQVKSERYKTAMFSPRTFTGSSTEPANADDSSRNVVGNTNTSSHSLSTAQSKESTAADHKNDGKQLASEKLPSVKEEFAGGVEHDAERPCGDSNVEEQAPRETDKSDSEKECRTAWNEDSREEDTATCWMLFKARMCCRERDHTSLPKTWWETAFSIVKWTIWTAVSLFCIAIVVINIGASLQVEVVNQRLPATYAQVYDNMNSGPVCAWDNNTGPDTTTIRTFSSPEEAELAGYDIVHCGACGECSTWINLKVEWDTRTSLASLAQKCAKKLFLKKIDEALQCHVDTIGFDETCSECWVEDEQCAMKNCVFIFLQAQLINKVGNFAVAPGTITSATCDEAICGPDFVRCSGATRRRMNITSGINRPGQQQCGIVRQDWAAQFGPYDEEYPPKF